PGQWLTRSSCRVPDPDRTRQTYWWVPCCQASSVGVKYQLVTGWEVCSAETSAAQVDSASSARACPPGKSPSSSCTLIAWAACGCAHGTSCTSATDCPGGRNSMQLPRATLLAPTVRAACTSPGWGLSSQRPTVPLPTSTIATRIHTIRKNPLSPIPVCARAGLRRCLVRTRRMPIRPSTRPTMPSGEVTTEATAVGSSRWRAMAGNVELPYEPCVAEGAGAGAGACPYGLCPNAGAAGSATDSLGACGTGGTAAGVFTGFCCGTPCGGWPGAGGGAGGN